MPQNKTKSGGYEDYLHRQGRLGLDPLDTSRTAAGIEGAFLKRLFTFTLRTRDVVSLTVMLLFGVSIIGFIGAVFYAIIVSIPPETKLDFMGYLMFIGFCLMLVLIFSIGVALVINFVINLGIILGFVKSKSNNGQDLKSKELKKKFPKRRKDFK